MSCIAAHSVFDNRIQIHTEDLFLFFFVKNEGALCGRSFWTAVSAPSFAVRLEIFWLSYKGHTVNALAQEGDEGRGKLR